MPDNGKKRAGRPVELQKKYTLATDKNHLLQLPQKRSVMTISFLFTPENDDEFPKFVLESADGSYRVELARKTALKKGSRFMDLRFEGLLPGKAYKLTQWHNSSCCDVLFDDVPYAELVDQYRPEVDKKLSRYRFIDSPARTK